MKYVLDMDSDELDDLHDEFDAEYEEMMSEDD